MNSVQTVIEIFKVGVKSVLPDQIIRKMLKIDNNKLCISDCSIDLSKLNNIYVIGAGKASALMGKEVENLLGNSITDGYIIVKYKHACNLKYIKVTEAGHPTPDAQGFQAAQELLNLVKKADVNDLVICLISGGGSSLLADFPDGSQPEDIIKLNKLLVNSGADIHEMNTVRKHFSKLKGGQLAKAIYPATLVSLILSDVIGDSLDVIASGPTSPDTTTFKDTEDILNKYNLMDKIAVSLRNYLQKGIEGKIPDTPKKGDSIFNKTYNYIIGSNIIALQNAENKAQSLGLKTNIVTSTLDGEAQAAAIYIVNEVVKKQNELKKGEKYCLLFGGETTVTLTGNGLGGRNQHLALCALQLLKDKKGITLLSAGTDGSDGPTDAAGAVINNEIWNKVQKKDINIVEYTENFDSYHFFQKAGGHIITGSTLTNVMDMIVVLIE